MLLGFGLQADVNKHHRTVALSSFVPNLFYILRFQKLEFRIRKIIAKMTSMLLALLTTPALLATNEAIRQGQTKDRREEHRARRSNLVVSCAAPSPWSRKIDHRQVALRNNKVCQILVPNEFPEISTKTPKIYIKTDLDDETLHPFAGYFLPYPDTKYEGLVSTITDEAPIMNWIYIDKETYEVKYGVRVDAQPNLTGPFDCTRQDRRLTFDKWEGFVAVRVKEGEEEGMWKLYFDVDDDGLVGKLGKRATVLEVELCRWEKRVRKGKPLGEMR